MCRENRDTLGIGFRLLHKDGTLVWVIGQFAPFLGEDRKVLGYIATFSDITGRRKAEKALRLSKERFSKAFNASPTTMSITTLEEGRYINVNERFCSVVGYTLKDILGRTSLELGFWVDPSDRAKVLQRLAGKQPVRDMEILFRRQLGDHRLGLYSAEKIDIKGEQCLLSIVTDITERKQAEEKIKYLSFNDKLTGLYNRAFFEEEMKRLDTPRQLPLSLIMGDINGLKLTNDALGHLEGDKLLIKVAEILKKSCRQEDCIARWGGDEFIVLLPGCDEINTAKVFERIKKYCRNIDDFPIQTSISLGMATKNYITRDLREVIKEAEDKMYRNKLLEARSARSTFLISLEKTLWTRSHETKEHCQRLQEIALKIGRDLNLPGCELDNLKLLAALHDIGKIAIPNNILENPGKLSPEDWETMKKHPEIGYRIALSSPEMAPIAEAILTHHERWDGTGYPLGLKEEEIPLISRIIAIADTYDVMVNGRPYQKPVTKEEALGEIENCAGAQFDPYLVKESIVVLLTT
jgi:diguanylate cyclase (GGDEF)-like protein/PAS domain S-box-containing protein